jgi:acyl-homoserine lactone acylase PvdQ
LRALFAVADERSFLPKLLEQALDKAIAKLREDLGADARKWHWSRYHKLTFQPFLRGFNWHPGPRGVAGGDRTVNVAPADGDGPFVVPYAASYRLIVELGPRVRAWGVLAGKQIDRQPRTLESEQQRWLDGRYRRRAFYADEVDKAASKRTLVTF